MRVMRQQAICNWGEALSLFNDVEIRSSRSLARTAASIALGIASTLLASILAVAGLLKIWSYPGRPKPFVDVAGLVLPGSISEKIRIEVNGVAQGMFLKGKDITNPVLLYLHGGMPDYFLAQKHPTGIEAHFTVAWWEQRGSGLSYDRTIPRGTMTSEQFIADTLEVTNYLRRRFDKEKIYLMGHSGGTFFGIQAVAREPQLYHAYLGVAQTVSQLRSEKRAYDYMVQQFRSRGDRRMVRKLQAAPVTIAAGTPQAYLEVRDQAMHRLGIGTTRDIKSVITGIFLQSLQCPDYTVAEKINMWRGKFGAGVSYLWNDMMRTDLATTVRELSMPIYLFHGIYDYTCSYAEAKAYFEILKAPLKGFYTFQQSAHSPIFEEPQKMLNIIQTDVLAGRNSLSDAV
jgi:pimeloyl-ACP methyl ester carboxylesterase